MEGRNRWRNRAVMILGVRTGMRISEILSLRVGDVWHRNGPRDRVYLPRKNTKGKTRGDSIVLHPKAGIAIAKWLTTRGPVKDTDWLFTPQGNPCRPLSRRMAWEFIHQALTETGVSGIRGSHCCRKTFSANVYAALNGDLFRLSVAMRHTSPLTTLAYLSFKQAEIDAAILRA